MVPSIVERSSAIDRELPLRVYSVTKGKEAVRLTFLASNEALRLLGHRGDRRGTTRLFSTSRTSGTGSRAAKYYFYYNGAHLHMVVLRTRKASYWVVNTLDDHLSNETMIEIAKGLKPLSR